jgi:hypothetical protein
MNDFWQVFGRLAADDDFRKTVYRHFPVQDYPSDEDDCGIVIHQRDYDDLRPMIAKTNPYLPMSVMALGEILMCISTDLFRTGFHELITAIKDSKVPLANRSPLFYAALGLMLIDGQIVGDFATDPNSFDRHQFGKLTDPEKADLVTIARDNNITRHANSVCYDYWSSGCNAQYSSYDKRVHPTATPYPPTPMPDGRRPEGPTRDKLRGMLT